MADLVAGAVLITGTGVATATATLGAVATERGYVLDAVVEVTAGTATLCRLELRSAAVTIYAETFPVQAAATATGGRINFPVFVPITAAVNTALNIVATTTGATTTNVYAVVSYGP